MAATDTSAGVAPKTGTVFARARGLASLVAGRLSLAGALALLLVAAQGLLIAFHAPGRDEVQAFLIVHDAGSIGAVLRALHYEGHPGAWYLLLGAASVLAPSLLALTLAQGLVATLNAALIWRFAPFGAWTRLALLASYFVFFEYGVLARNYGLGLTFLLGFLATRGRLWGWVFLGLMANVTSHFLLMSAALVVSQAWIERRWSWRGVALWAAGCLLAVLTMAPARDALPAVGLAPEPAVRLLLGLHWFSTALLPVVPGQVGWGKTAPLALSLIVFAIMPGLAACSLRRDRRALAILYGFGAGLLGMSVLLYPLYARHAGLLFLLLIALEWMRCERQGVPSSPAFRVWLAVSALCGLWMMVCSIVTPFSPGGRLADWITRSGLAGRPWAAYPGWLGLDISSRLGVPTYNLQKQCLNTYQKWNYQAEPKLPAQQLRGRLLAAAAQQGGRLYLLSDVDPALLTGAGAVPIVAFRHFLIDDPETVYVVRTAVAAAPHPAPTCR